MSFHDTLKALDNTNTRVNVNVFGHRTITYGRLTNHTEGAGGPVWQATGDYDRRTGDVPHHVFSVSEISRIDGVTIYIG